MEDGYNLRNTKRNPYSEAAARNAEDVKAQAIAEMRAQSREELDALVKSTKAAVTAALTRAETAEAAAAHAAAAFAAAQEDAEAEAAAAAVTTSATATVETHPTYGTLLHDFGYKKVYAMPAVHLVSKDKAGGGERERGTRPIHAHRV